MYYVSKKLHFVYYLMYSCYPLLLWSLYSSKTSMTCSKYVARSVIHFSTVALEEIWKAMCSKIYKLVIFCPRICYYFHYWKKPTSNVPFINYGMKVCLLVTFVNPCPLFFIVSKIMDRMGDGPIVSIIHTVTIDKMLNNNSCNNGHGLKTLHVNIPLPW